ncbi:MAG: hypothetical protein IT442_12615 [Phycisphaeraceae bacterium]|nr:hypothetical protein [Phycisphaeraceae bacterium]
MHKARIPKHPLVVRKSDVSKAKQWLIDKMQSIGFGRIEGLRIVGGDPVSTPPPKIIYRRKSGGVNEPRPHDDAHDYVLKKDVVELMQSLDTLRDRTISLIEVSHGVPILWEFAAVT